MDSLIINGGKKLIGDIPISGSKNACLPMMIASLMTDEKMILNNIPMLSDVKTLISILESLGANAVHIKNSLNLHTKEIINHKASYDLVKKMRASFWVLAPLLAKSGYAEVSLPGGCAIGTRPIDLYLKILKEMNINYTINNGYIVAKREGPIKGLNFKLEKKSVGCTHFFLMLACLANGTSKLSNASCEPEVIHLGLLLNKMGAKIKGLGSKKIIIEGVKKLNGVTEIIPSDRIETGTFAIAVSATGGKVKLENTNYEENKLLFNILEKTGSIINKSKNSISIEKNHNKIYAANIKTSPYPGFPTDLQAQIMALMTISNGKSEIKENIFENRFMHVQELARMGANIKLDKDRAIIKGVRRLNGANVMATDLRASASLIIAGLVATGTTKISRIYHLDRGFYNLENKLNNCGASIKRISE
jgi:UDP-N-acetylglucosamine 1-carboxyvinyltransferase